MSSIEDLRGLAKKLAEEYNKISPILRQYNDSADALILREFNKITRNIKAAEEYRNNINESLRSIENYLKECKEKYRLEIDTKDKKQNK